jgi:hypothetical protein
MYIFFRGDAMEISNTTLSYPDYHWVTASPEYPLLLMAYRILTRYLWIGPTLFGVPGNILSILVANRKHNRGLSPCIYMKAMAVADTLFLVQHAFFLPLVYFDIGETDIYLRKLSFK